MRNRLIVLFVVAVTVALAYSSLVPSADSKKAESTFSRTGLEEALNAASGK
jgi:hypothetical protein